MSSYRKKRYPAKAKNETMKQPAEAEFANPGVERSIHTGRLTSGLPYQRPVNPKEVERLVREWDGRLLEPAVVSFRDGKFFVVDGQHRIAAMCRMNGGNGVMAACRVYTGLTYEQEAELCYRLDKAKKRLSLSQSTNVLVEAGSDKETLEIKRLVESAGFTWALNKSHGKTGEITATRALAEAYRMLGEDGFLRMLSLMHETWKGEPGSLTASLLSGMALFVKTYGEDFTDRAFITKLSKVEPEEISRRGKADLSTGNGALKCARVILEKYNGRRGGRKLAYKFSG